MCMYALTLSLFMFVAGHAYSIESISSNMAIFRSYISTLSVTLKKNTGLLSISDCSEAAAQNHPFSKISPENTGDRVLLLVKLQADCSEYRFYTKITPTRMLSWKSFKSF